MGIQNILNKNRELLKKYPGFTILEITVCIFIIVMALVGILSLANQNVQVGTINKNMLVASQLAQEGLEAVRNKRDMNWLKSGAAFWETSSSTNSYLDILQGTAIGTPVSYTVDAYTGQIANKNVSISDPSTQLYMNGGGFYTHNSAGATATGFSRLITVGNQSNASTSVTCLVQWSKGTNTYNFSAQTVLYNWK
jgi:Tfp pilus assembly protein PilV